MAQTTFATAPAPCVVHKVSEESVSVGKNTMSIPEFTNRMADLGYDKDYSRFGANAMVIGGNWYMALPAAHIKFLETPGNFTRFVREQKKGFGA